MTNVDYAKYASVIKRIAITVNPLITKKNKLKEAMEKLDAQCKAIIEGKKAKLQAEYDALTAQQEVFERPIRELTGGYGVEDLVIAKLIEKGLNKDGKMRHTTQYELKYPNTIVPPEIAGERDLTNDEGGDLTSSEVGQEEPSFNPYKRQ